MENKQSLSSPAGERENIMGTMDINPLLIKLSVPMMVSMLVQALYNVVDSIFVSHVSESALTAVSLAFSLQNVMIAVGVGTGVGVNALLSKSLGEKNFDAANKAAVNGIFLAFCSWAAFALLGGFFSRTFMALQTDVPEIIAYGDTYLTIIAVASVGMMFQICFERLLQSTGKTIYTMLSQGLGAVINLILDPIFIFPLKMGVVGAGIATVIGQVAAGCLALLYLRRLKTVHIRREDLRPTRKLTCRILALGFPSLLTQMLSALVQITLNNLMRAYGAATVYGSDIALSVYGMMMKVYQIAHSMFVGVSSAIQPINGYNFGANHYARVQKTFHIASLIAVGISVVWFLIFMVFPRQIASCFVSDNALYLDCAQHCFRLYMLAFFLYGLHMTSASFFQGIGRPGKSLLIPLARQGCFLIPLALLLSRSFGLDGALLAAPIADALAFPLCLLLARWEFRSWRRKGWLCKGERKYRAS